jgi:hypothetical protein
MVALSARAQIGLMYDDEDEDEELVVDDSKGSLKEEEDFKGHFPLPFISIFCFLAPISDNVKKRTQYQAMDFICLFTRIRFP